MTPRIAVLSVYFTLFDAQMPPDFRARQEAWIRELTEVLAASFDVAAFTGLITSEDEAETARALLQDTDADVVVFVPPMAAPPSYAAVALEGMELPVVLWNAPATDRLGGDLDQASAHEYTSMLGVLMYANVRERRAEPLHVVTARPGDPEAMDRLIRTIGALAAARRLRGGTVVRIGVPYPGYLNIEADAQQLSRLGLEERDVGLGELQDAYDSADARELEELAAEVAAHGWHGEPDERSLRVAVALRRLASQHRAVCGAVNCHGPLLRRNDDIGVSACLGVSACTAAGIPFACMADTPTAIALALGRELAGRVLYCEFYSAELATGTLLIANGGEGDTGWDAAVRLVPNAHYPGVRGAGTALAFDLEPGPVTVLSMSPIGNTWRLVWATGELVESRYPRMQAPNAMFRFSTSDAAGALDAWLASGATHHNALVPGHLDLEVPLAAGTLGIESHRI